MKREMESVDCAVELVCRNVPIEVEPYTSDHARGVLAKRQIMTWLRMGRFFCVTLPAYARAVRHGAWEVLRNTAIIAGLWLVVAILMVCGS